MSKSKDSAVGKSEEMKENEQKTELEKYDIYKLKPEIERSILEADRKKDYQPIDDIKAFLIGTDECPTSGYFRLSQRSVKREIRN